MFEVVELLALEDLNEVVDCSVEKAGTKDEG